MKIEIFGEPATQGNHRTNQHGATYDTNKKLGPWREAVRAETARAVTTARNELSFVPDKGDAVAVNITFFLKRPAGHYGTGGNSATIRPSAPKYPAKRPDLDKLLRAVLDGIRAGGAVPDDGAVVSVQAAKIWADGEQRPGCLIELTGVFA